MTLKHFKPHKEKTRKQARLQTFTKCLCPCLEDSGMDSWPRPPLAGSLTSVPISPVKWERQHSYGIGAGRFKHTHTHTHSRQRDLLTVLGVLWCLLSCSFPISLAFQAQCKELTGSLVRSLLLHRWAPGLTTPPSLHPRQPPQGRLVPADGRSPPGAPIRHPAFLMSPS